MLETIIILTIITVIIIGGAMLVAISYNDDDCMDYFKNEAKAPCSNADYEFLSQNSR